MASAHTLRTRVIVLGRTKLAETDLILTLLAESGCQLRAVAKGARKPGSKLAARCELFSEADMLLAQGRNLHMVNQAELVDAHDTIRGDLARVSVASAIAEIARLTSFEDATDRLLYPICSRALLAVEQAADQPHLELICAAYTMKVLAHAGWRPELTECIECGDPHPTYFSAQAGGALCESCASSYEGARPADANQLRWLSSLIALTFDELLATPIDEVGAEWLCDVVHEWAAVQLDARLRAWEFMRAQNLGTVMPFA